ncbi:MAG: acetyl-CoA acetyltransferase [Kordiimonas sp.]|nr:acetyl-CoA acetyltransferase [Kordiimonas sp.]
MATAYIYDALRSPRGRGKSDGALHSVTPIDLLTQTFTAVKERNHLLEDCLDDVITGCVTGVGEQGGNMGRFAALKAGLGQSVPGVHINRFCASGLVAVNYAACRIIADMADLIIAAGVESMSRVPMGYDGAAAFSDPAVAGPLGFVPQGISADLIATKYGFTREQCDALAVESQKRAKAAWDAGYFEKSIVPIKDPLNLTLLDHDEHMRPDVTLDSLSALKPSFVEMGALGFDSVALQKYPDLEFINHIHHPGNASGIVDGAAALLIGNRESGDKLGLTPRARITSFADHGSEPTIMLTGPAEAAKKALARANMTKNDIDVWEVNEAFSSVVLRFLQEMDMDASQVNVNGGAIAMGHPLGATGAIILGTALDEMERCGASTALATLCVAGGMATATIIERV